jgi:hypothetical protein
MVTSWVPCAILLEAPLRGLDRKCLWRCDFEGAAEMFFIYGNSREGHNHKDDKQGMDHVLEGRGVVDGQWA